MYWTSIYTVFTYTWDSYSMSNKYATLVYYIIPKQRKGNFLFTMMVQHNAAPIVNISQNM